MIGALLPWAHRADRASTSFATATSRCSTSAGLATCAPGFAPTSKASGSGPRSKQPCSRLGGLNGACSAPRLEAALEELRLIRELQPPANSRSRRKEHGVYLKRRGEELVVTRTATRLGPIASRRRASLAARALALSTAEELDGLLQGEPLPRLRGRLSHLAENLRYEEAARLRDRIESLEQVVERLRRLERLRGLEALPRRAGARAGLAEGLLRLRRGSLRRSLAVAGSGRETRDRGRAGALSRRSRQRRRDADP